MSEQLTGRAVIPPTVVDPGAPPTAVGGILDDFERTEVDVLGVASSGYVWDTSGDTGARGVNGSAAYAAHQASVNGGIVGRILANDPSLYEDLFDRVSAFGLGDSDRYTDETGTSVDGSTLVVASDVGAAIGWPGAPWEHGDYQFDLYIPADVTDYGYYELDTRDVGGVGVFVFAEAVMDGDWYIRIGQQGVGTYSDFTFTPDASSWYTLKLQVDSGALEYRAKIWKVGTSEPAYQVERTYTGTASSWIPGLYIYGPASEPARLDNLIAPLVYPDPWALDHFRMRMKFRAFTINDLGQFIRLYWDFAGSNPWIGVNISTSVGDGGFALDGTLIPVPSTGYPKTDWVSGQWYYAELEREIGGSTTLTVWPVEDTQPSPQCTGGTGAYSLAGQDLLLILGPVYDTGQQTEVDQIEFVGFDPPNPATVVSVPVIRASVSRK